MGSGVFYNGMLVPNQELGRVTHLDGNPIEFYASNSARKREELKLQEWAVRFDYFLKQVARFTTPDLFIIGGGLSKKYEKFQEHLTVDVPISISNFRNNAGIIGAAVYAERAISPVSY